MTTIQAAVEKLTLSDRVHYKHLSVFPVLRPTSPDPRYLTLDEALEAGLFTVREVSETGTVPRLQVENRADRPVLLVDGEELTGAKQNRILNLTILVPAGKTMDIPVSCVEAGRWHYSHGERRSTSSQDALFYKARAAKSASVSESMRMEGEAVADQARVWGDIEESMEVLGAVSPTSAMSSLYAGRGRALEDYAKHLRPVTDQVGAVFGIGDRVAGLEFFDSAATWGKLYPKILRSYALETEVVGLERVKAAGAKGEMTPTPPTGEQAEAFLADVAAAEAERYPAIGLGEDVRLSRKGRTGGGLVLEEDVVHLAAFATE